MTTRYLLKVALIKAFSFKIEMVFSSERGMAGRMVSIMEQREESEVV